MPEFGDLFRRLVTPKLEPVSRTGRFAEIASNRLDTPKLVQTQRGLVIYGTDEGVNYKPVNEDAIVVDTIHDAFAVIDGMGGMGQGDVAARILAEELLSGFNKGRNPWSCQKNASERMGKAGVGRGGACYMAVQLDDGKIDGYYAGDVQMSIIRGGRVVFTSIPENKPGDASIVTNTVQGTNPGETRTFTLPALDGDRIIVASDGLWDNFRPEEIQRLISDLPIQEAIKKLDRLAKEKMRSGGKPDNISILIYEISSTPSDLRPTAANIQQTPQTKPEETRAKVGPITIPNAASWEDLEKVVKAGSGIHGSREYFSPQDLTRIIADVRAGRKDILSVTGAGGLRAKVEELLEKDKHRR